MKRATALRTGLAGALVLTAVLGLGAAGSTPPRLTGLADLPLPGGADLGDHPYRVHAEFADVLSLFPHSSVKVNDVAVGRVTGISLADDGWTATVTMEVNGDVDLPGNAYAYLEQSSLLGEKYVQLAAPPAGEESGALGDGATIPLARTGRNPEVEEVFGALSMLLNGGGVQQIRTISRELNAALEGNEPEARSALRRVAELTGNLDEHKGDITAALDSIDRLSARLSARQPEIEQALSGLSPGLAVLEEQRGSLVGMLRALDGLSDVAVETLDAGAEDIVADLKALAPTLEHLADAGQDLPDSLEALATFPFTDEVLRGVKGDYLNVYLDVTARPGTTIIPPLDPAAAPGADGAGADAAGGAENAEPAAAALPLPAVTGTTVTTGEGE
ncbi:MCE family protein [Streptomyces sp. TRM70308]|uniref:MCE family protein n=1 Tax=Streptomyces sp. TRM70308 TaxID=3131932 RepID=UPI003D02CBC9